MKKSKPKFIFAWHFLNGDKLRDGRPAPPDGEWLIHPEAKPLTLCQFGLHASKDILDALSYAPGLTLCRVRCAGKIAHGDDKLVCRKRQIVWRLDAPVMRNVIIDFAQWCAERAKQHAAAARSADAADAARYAAAATSAATSARYAAAHAAAHAARYAAAATSAATSAAARSVARAAADATLERNLQSQKLRQLVAAARKASK